jgi:hypothetical protein
MTNPILSVITSYYNRPENRRLFKESIKDIDRSQVEFIIVSYIGEPFNFSTGRLHNLGVSKARGKWIVKQDIDCVIKDKGHYYKLIEHLKDKPDTYFMNIGVKSYLGNDNDAFGNEYVCSKVAYNEVGGEPEFKGYFGEDYAMLYKLAKYADKTYKLNYDCGNVDNIIKRDLARVKNKENDFYYIHNKHKMWPDKLQDYKRNKKLLYKICQELDNE